jgi:hypothetical protein
MLMEHVAHETLRHASRHCDVPLVVNATRVGAGPLDRECISLDLSASSDPMDIRHARTAFSAHPVRLQPRDAARPDHCVSLAPIATIPRARMSLPEALEVRADLVRVAELAMEARTTLPSVDAGVSSLAREYRRSPLRAFHEAFLAEPVDLERAREDRRRIDAMGLPRCVAACLAAPNDLLLRPEHMQNLTRLLLTRGWTARRIASLIQVVYEEDHGWGDRWQRMDERTRAEAYVRTFAGLVAAGMDRMVDFTCVSTQEKGLCPGGACGHELALDRARLLGRGR